MRCIFVPFFIWSENEKRKKEKQVFFHAGYLNVGDERQYREGERKKKGERKRKGMRERKSA